MFFRLAFTATVLAFFLALFRKAKTTLANIPMIATTTRSSIKVKAEVKPKLLKSNLLESTLSLSGIF